MSEPRGDDAALLYRVSQIALRSNNLQRVLTDTLDLLVAARGFDFGTVRLQRQQGVLEVAASSGLMDPSWHDAHPVHMRDPDISPLAWNVVFQREPYVEEDVPAAVGLQPLKREGVRSTVVVPVATEDEVLGTLTVGTRTRRRFDPSEVTLLAAVGGEIGLAIQKIALYEETRRLSQEAWERLEEVGVLYGLTHTVMSSPDLPSVLERVLDAALGAAHMELGSVRVMGREGTSISAIASRGYTDVDFMEVRGRNLREHPLRSLSETLGADRPVLYTDVQQREGMRHFKQEGVHTAVVLPLRAGTETIGVMYLGSRTPVEVTDRHLGLLDAIGSHAGLAIQKARLFQETAEAYAELKRAESALRESEERYRAVVENMRDGVAVSVEGKHVFVNQTFLAIHGLSDPSEALGKPFESFVLLEDQENVRTIIQDLQRGDQQSLLHDLRIRRSEGEVRILEVSAVPIVYERRPAALSLFRDVTNRKRMEAQVAYLAEHDPLTDLLNRRRFEEEMERELLGQAAHGNGALIYLDLDGFKEINDSLGHAAGDVVLKSIGALLAAQVRETDTVGRVGGDEFTVLMPDASTSQAEAAASRILMAIEGHRVEYQGQELRVTASAGVAMFSDHGTGKEGLLVAADRALYRAKERGGNRAEVSPLEVALSGRMALAYQVRQALLDDTFLFDAQPILDLRTGGISQHELLLRLPDADGNLVCALEFLPTVERSALLQLVDRWVVQRAVRLLSEQERAGCRIVLEVNLSGRALADPEFLPLIRGLLQDTGADPTALIFEITESEAVPDLKQAREFMQSLRDLGCRFALDDFGVGFSSFNHLRHLPVDYLKIDGSFIVDLCSDRANQHVVEAMVAIGRALGIKTVAESVEDAVTLALIRDLGVDYAQGYYIGRPTPAADLIRRTD